MARAKAKRATRPKPPRGVRLLKDTEHARAVHAYLMHNGDVAKTYQALKRKVSKRTLQWYAKRYRWDLRLEDQQNQLVQGAADDALAKKKLDLQLLRSTKTHLYLQIRGQKDPNDKDVWLLPPLRARSLEEATRALLEVIREERAIIGRAGGATGEDQRGGSVFTWVALAVAQGKELSAVDVTQEAQQGNGDGEGEGEAGGNGNRLTGPLDLDDDPFGIR